MQEEAQDMQQQKAEEIDQLKVIYTSEVEQLKLQVRDLNSDIQHVNVKNEAEVTELKAKTVIYKAQVKSLHQEREQCDTQQTKEREQFQNEALKCETLGAVCQCSSSRHCTI